MAALVISLGLTVVTAGAGDRLKAKSKTVTVGGAPAHESVNAKCKRGTKAISGGFEAEIDLSDFGPFVVPTTSSRLGGRRWTAAAVNESGTPGSLTAFAYCRDERLKQRSKSITVNPSVIGEEVIAKCPKRTKAVSGGFVGEVDLGPSGGPEVRSESSYKVGKRKWEVYGFGAGSEPGTMTATVNCRRRGKKLSTRQASELVSGGFPTVDSAEIVAKCKRKQRVVSGGHEAPSLLDPDNSGVRVTTSRRAGKRKWQITATAFNENVDPTTVFAYCEKK